jgi:hypothetical protein
MQKRPLTLTFVIMGIVILSQTHVFLQHKFEEVQSPSVEFIFSKEDYFFSFLKAAIVYIFPAFALGYLSWLTFGKKPLKKVIYFTAFSLVGLVLLGYSNAQQLYAIWHYHNHQANMNYNKRFTKRHGNFLDTCMLLVQKDIESQGVLPKDFRVLSYSYDETLNTVPKDTANNYYAFDVVYFVEKSGKKEVRAAKYFINPNGEIQQIYNVDAKNEKAKAQVDSLKEDFKKLKRALQVSSDSSSKQLMELKSKLHTIN